MSALLEIERLHLELGAGRHWLPILRGVELALCAGEVLGLVGESGAGKTMVGKAVLGLQPERARISEGAIRFAGRDITHLGERARRALLGRGMSLIPQDPMSALNPVMRIGAQMLDVIRPQLGLDAAGARAKAIELLQAVHMREPERVLRLYPHELSGGMRQRVLIATAFACRPQLIVADEPTTALDVTVQRQILRLIKELQANSGTALLFITHDLGVVAKICDRVAVMHSGRILEEAPVAEIFARPCHAYTRALLAATPRYDRPADALAPVPPAILEQLAQEAAAYDAGRAAHA
jgi:peptide/nickel transport system ATP-binding protein